VQAIQQNHSDIAKIYAQNAIRKQNEKLNLLRLASRIDAVSSRVQTAVTMRQVTGSMANVVRGMDSAMKSMDLERVSSIISSGSCMVQRENISWLLSTMLPPRDTPTPSDTHQRPLSDEGLTILCSPHRGSLLKTTDLNRNGQI
jgi:hypothetical protein